jgi:hypothetical protein
MLSCVVCDGLKVSTDRGRTFKYAGGIATLRTLPSTQACCAAPSVRPPGSTGSTRCASLGCHSGCHERARRDGDCHLPRMPGVRRIRELWPVDTGNPSVIRSGKVCRPTARKPRSTLGLLRVNPKLLTPDCDFLIPLPAWRDRLTIFPLPRELTKAVGHEKVGVDSAYHVGEAGTIGRE